MSLRIATYTSSALAAVAIGVLLSGCNKSSSPTAAAPAIKQENGGQDGGGGLVLRSTKQQVRDTILKAYNVALILSPGSGNDPDSGVTTSNDRFKLLHLDLRFQELAGDVELKNVVQKVFFLSETRSGFKSIGEYLSQSQLVLKESGSCRSFDKEHPDASVTNRRFGSDICFSVEKLQRIAPNALPREIFALLMHEVAHLNGFGEEQAIQFQKLAAKVINPEILKAESFLGSLNPNLESIKAKLSAQIKKVSYTTSAGDNEDGQKGLPQEISKTVDLLHSIHPSLLELVHPLSQEERREKCYNRLESHCYSWPGCMHEYQPVSLSFLIEQLHDFDATQVACAAYIGDWLETYSPGSKSQEPQQTPGSDGK